MPQKSKTTILHGSFDARDFGASGGTMDGISWVLNESLCADLYALATAMQTAIRDATESEQIIVELIDNGENGFRIRRSDNGSFSCTFGNILADVCGFNGAYSTVTVVESANPPAFAYFPSLPILDADVWYEYIRSFDAEVDGIDPIVSYSSMPIVRFNGRLMFDHASLESFRTFMDSAIRGRQFRLFLDITNATEWSEANRSGYLDLRLVNETKSEAWENEPTATFGSFALDAIVIVPIHEGGIG